MCHLFPPAHNAGAERMLLAMLRALTARGHTVDVVLSQQHKEITAAYDLDGVQVHPLRGKNDPFRFLGDADVVVTHLENTQRASVLAQMCGLPLIHVCHNTFDQTRRWLQRVPPTLAVFNSRWMADLFAGLTSRSIIIPPPVHMAAYATTPGDAVTLINLFESKGSKTFYALAERFPDQLFLGVRGAYGTQHLREAPNVEILDHIDGDHMAAKVYARTRILLMPSIYESYGRTALEAACSGIPTIAHPTEGLKESLGAAGIFCDRDDIDAWESALRSLADGRKWNGASRRAKKRARELAPEEDLARWCDAVEEVANGRPRRRRRP